MPNSVLLLDTLYACNSEESQATFECHNQHAQPTHNWIMAPWNAKPAPNAPAKDGGIIVALVLLVGALAAVFFSAIVLYASADIGLTKEQKEKTIRARRIARLLSGWANVGNAMVHALLISMLIGEVDSPVGPAVMLATNAIVGFRSLTGGGIQLALFWNSFVAVRGILSPMIWRHFLDVGLISWPFRAVFLWLAMFAFEVTGFFFSIVAYWLKDAHTVKSD